MTCKTCSAEMPDDHHYCGVCGAKLSLDPFEEAMLRLTDLGARLDKQMQMRDQRFLEVDTTEKVVTRLMNWAKLFAFFVGIPVATVLVGLVVYAGKGFKDLHKVAGSARDSIRPALEKARSDAETAKRIAAEALQSSTGVSRTVALTKEGISGELKRNHEHS